MIYGSLTVVEEGLWLQYPRVRKRAARCRCICGNEVIRAVSKLKSGEVKSCSCQRGHGGYHATGPSPAKAAANTRHGMTGSPTFSSWTNMKQRCNNPKAVNYEYYGGRGIVVCDRWLSFENFLADMGERPEDMTLDRYPDKNGNYEPGNCRWATQQEQADNRATEYRSRKIYGIA